MRNATKWLGVLALCTAMVGGAVVFAHPQQQPFQDMGGVGSAFTGGTISGDATLVDDVSLVAGTGSDSVYQYDTTEGNDTLKIGVGADSRHLLIVEKADVDVDYSLSAATNPRLCIASADATSVTDTICMYHDQANAFIETDALLKFVATGTVHNDAIEAYFGSGADATISYESAQTPDAMWVGVGSDSRGIIIGEKADRLTDYGLAQTTNPTLYVVSADATATTDYVSIYHDQTNGNLDVGSGNLHIGASQVRLPDGAELVFGTGNDAALVWETAQTPDTLWLGVGTDSEHMIFGQKADAATDYGLAQATDPTLYIVSADSTSPTDYLALSHNQTNAVMSVGAGNLTLDTTLNITGGVTATATSSFSANVLMGDDDQQAFGAASDARTLWSTAQTNDSLLTILSGSNTWVIAEVADLATDWTGGNETDPTLRIQSADEASVSDFLKLQHDQTNGVITTGAGALSLVAANGEVHIGDAADANGVIELATSTAGYAGEAGRGSLWVESDGLHYRYETDHVAILSAPRFRSGMYSSPGSAATDYIMGFYEAPAADYNLTQASTTGTIGTANGSYAAHIVTVAGAAGTCDSGCTICRLDVEGTTINDSGTRAATQTITIISDVTGESTDNMTETSEKWIGQVTFRLVPDAGNCSFTFNGALAKYDDWGNRDAHISDVECTGLAGGNDSGFNVGVMHHKATGWTYHATAFVPGTGYLWDMNTDHNTEVNLVSGDQFAWKRAGLAQDILGADSEGFLFKVVTGGANTVDYMTCSIGADLH